MEKKKTRNFKVGDVLKGTVDPKTGKNRPDYIKLNTSNPKTLETLRQLLDKPSEKGLYLDLKSKSQQQADYQDGVQSGRLNGDWVEKMGERIDGIPDFVRFEIYARVEKN